MWRFLLHPFKVSIPTHISLTCQISPSLKKKISIQLPFLWKRACSGPQRHTRRLLRKRKQKKKKTHLFSFFSSGFAFISLQTIRERKGKPSKIIWELFSSAKRNLKKKGGDGQHGAWRHLKLTLAVERTWGRVKKLKFFFCSFLFSVCWFEWAHDNDAHTKQTPAVVFDQ